VRLFYALAVLAHLHYAERPSAGRYAAVLAASALALLAKPMAVTLPVALWLLDYWPLQRWRTRRALLEKLPLFALSLGAALVTIAAQSSAIVRLERLPLGFRWSSRWSPTRPTCATRSRRPGSPCSIRSRRSTSGTGCCPR